MWDSARGRVVEAAMLGTGVDFAADTWSRVRAELDTYAGSWVAAHTDACEAHQRGEQSSAALDLRMHCLHRRRIELEALVEVLAAADAPTVTNAVQAVHGLPSPVVCADPVLLSEQRRLDVPEDPTTAAAVEALRGRLAQVESKMLAGQYERGLALSGQLLVRRPGPPRGHLGATRAPRLPRRGPGEGPEMLVGKCGARTDLRGTIDGIRWVLHSGAKWREMPAKYGKATTAWRPHAGAGRGRRARPPPGRDDRDLVGDRGRETAPVLGRWRNGSRRAAAARPRRPAGGPPRPARGPGCRSARRGFGSNLAALLSGHMRRGGCSGARHARMRAPGRLRPAADPRLRRGGARAQALEGGPVRILFKAPWRSGVAHADITRTRFLARLCACVGGPPRPVFAVDVMVCRKCGGRMRLLAPKTAQNPCLGARSPTTAGWVGVLI